MLITTAFYFALKFTKNFFRDLSTRISPHQKRGYTPLTDYMLVMY